MAFWNEPIEFQRLWRGPRIATPFASYSLTLLGRVLVVASYVLLAVFLVVLIAFNTLAMVASPAVFIGCCAAVGAIAGGIWLWNRAHPRSLGHTSPPEDPDEPTEGGGVPIPRVPTPILRVGSNASEAPNARRRVG